MALGPKAGWGLVAAVLLVLLGTLLSDAIPTARPRLLIAVNNLRTRSLIEDYSGSAGHGGIAVASDAGRPDSTGPGLPPDFDWEAYKFFNPDFASGLTTAAQAEQHYLEYGRQGRRLYKQIPITFSYMSIAGLCNQLFSHLSLLAIASAFNATLVLPSAHGRADFKGSWSFHKEPIESLLDVQKMTSYWEPRGLTLTQTPRTASCLVWELPLLSLNMNRPRFSVRQIVATLAGTISKRAGAVLHKHPGKPVCMRVRYGFPWTSLLPDFPKSVPDMNRAARGVFFAPALVQKADAIVAAMEASHHTPFSGVHLRIEGDWTTHGPTEAREGDLLEVYVRNMREAGFNEETPVYVASGIFSYANDTEIKELKERFASEGVCSALLHKEALLPPAAFEGLHSEQLALVDLLVLSRARLFVGDERSSFAGFTEQYRALHGIPNSTFINIRPRFKFFVFTRRLLRHLLL